MFDCFHCHCTCFDFAAQCAKLRALYKQHEVKQGQPLSLFTLETMWNSCVSFAWHLQFLSLRLCVCLLPSCSVQVWDHLDSVFPLLPPRGQEAVPSPWWLLGLKLWRMEKSTDSSVLSSCPCLQWIRCYLGSHRLVLLGYAWPLFGIVFFCFSPLLSAFGNVPFSMEMWFEWVCPVSSLFKKCQVTGCWSEKGKKSWTVLFCATMVWSSIVSALSTNRAASRNTCKIAELVALVISAHSHLVSAITFLCHREMPPNQVQVLGLAEVVLQCAISSSDLFN